MKSIKKIISALFLTLMSATALYAEPWNMMGNGYHMMGYGGMGWMMIFFWVAVLICMVMVIKWIYSIVSDSDSVKSRKPIDILKERLAKGEIEIDEYEEKKRIISGS